MPKGNHVVHSFFSILLSFLYSHRMVLVSGPFSGSPAHYLDPEDKILSVKAGAPPTAMFILCVSMPGQGPLEIIDSVRQNVSIQSSHKNTEVATQ